MKSNKNLIAAAAVAGLFAGANLHALSVAGHASDGSTITLQQKKPAADNQAPAEGEKEKCSGKDGCKGKKDGEKAKCSGKDGCPGKKDGEAKKAS